MIYDDGPEALLGGTGQASGDDPIADKEVPPARPRPAPPKAVVTTRWNTGDNPYAVPLRPLAGSEDT